MSDKRVVRITCPTCGALVEQFEIDGYILAPRIFQCPCGQQFKVMDYAGFAVSQEG